MSILASQHQAEAVAHLARRLAHRLMHLQVRHLPTAERRHLRVARRQQVFDPQNASQGPLSLYTPYKIHTY